jgi:hypothetical protein
VSLLFALVVIYHNLQVERGWVCSALHDISHQVDVHILGMLPGALENNAAAQGETARALHCLQFIHISLIGLGARMKAVGTPESSLRRFMFSSPMAVAMNRHNVLMKAPSVPRESHDFLLSCHVTSTPIFLLQPAYRL